MTIFPDLVHVERIADALWRKSPLGTAALMVGAGLSCNARNIAAPGRSMPTWDELGKRLCDSLYPLSDKSCSRQREHALKKAAATSGALRLAQEFEASFGRTELNRLLKNYVPDEEFAPSPLHEDLLKLPWADVFTTNWDTLLERATDAVVDRRYDVVRTRDDIPASQQPRIVKLHGSFPSNYPFIFSEEDYRKYPADFPWFVNIVQQSMMENLFCLVGFSGDDPNFLHWAGWVRDNLGEAAPKIYLVGWLDLAPVQRRVLENRNIIPVDLSRLPQSTPWPEECRHRYALEWFQWMLKLKQPLTSNSISIFQREHRPSPPGYLEINLKDFDHDKVERLSGSKISGKDKDAERLKEIRGQMPLWREDRNNYEGWVIAPQRVRNKFWIYTQKWVGDATRVIPCMASWERLLTLREIVWRLDVCLAPLFDNLIEPLVQTLNEIDPCERTCSKDGQAIIWPEPDWAEVRRAWSELAIFLLQHYRLEGATDKFELLAPRIDKLTDCNGVLDALSYQRTTLALQRMDYTTARVTLDLWLVERSDHIWAIRKAGILFELGEFDAAHELLTATLPAIRRSIRRDIDDYAALSREGCAMQLIEIAEWENRYRGEDAKEEQDRNGTNNPDWQARWKTLLAKDCDIRDEWQSICAPLEVAPPDPRDTREIRKRGFDLGQVSTNRHYGSGGKFLPAYRALAFAEAAGMPPIISTGFSGVIVSANGLKRAAIWLKKIDPELAVRIIQRTCTSESDETLNTVATRETIAQLNSDFVDDYITVLLQGAGFVSKEIGSDEKQLEKLRVAMELLSRLIPRLINPGKKKEVFDLAVTLVHNASVSGDLWLAGALSNLLRRAIDSFDKHSQLELILPLLRLPTADIDERTFGGEPLWDKILKMQQHEIPSIRVSNPEGWSEAISRLLSDVEKMESRKRAVWRLTFLHSNKLLDESEQLVFAKALWADEFTGGIGLPEQTDLFPWVFMDLPEHEEGIAERLIREKYLTEEGAAKISHYDYLKEFGSIAWFIREKKNSFPLSEGEISILTSKILVWAKEEHRPSPPIFPRSASQRMNPIIAGVVQILPFSSINEEEILQIKARIEALESDKILCYELYPPLITKYPELAEGLIARLKTGIASDDPDSASNAVHALGYWLSLAETGHATLPPDHLLEEVGWALYLRREPVLATALLFCGQLFEKQPAVAKRTIAERALAGLNYIFKSCQYDQAIESGLAERIDVPLVRYYCVKLAIAMTKAGNLDQPVLSLWIDAAKDDPLSEVRNLVA